MLPYKLLRDLWLAAAGKSLVCARNIFHLLLLFSHRKQKWSKAAAEAQRVVTEKPSVFWFINKGSRVALLSNPVQPPQERFSSKLLGYYKDCHAVVSFLGEASCPSLSLSLSGEVRQNNEAVGDCVSSGLGAHSRYLSNSLLRIVIHYLWPASSLVGCAGPVSHILSWNKFRLDWRNEFQPTTYFLEEGCNHEVAFHKQYFNSHRRSRTNVKEKQH